MGTLDKLSGSFDLAHRRDGHNQSLEKTEQRERDQEENSQRGQTVQVATQGAL